MESCKVVGMDPFIVQDAIEKMRDIDILEFTVLGESKYDAVFRCANMSDEMHALVTFEGDEPVFVWGFGPNPTRPGWDVAWGFGTDLMVKHRWEFIGRMGESVNRRLSRCKGVSNYVYQFNTEAIKGLHEMGFTGVRGQAIPAWTEQSSVRAIREGAHLMCVWLAAVGAIAGIASTGMGIAGAKKEGEAQKRAVRYKSMINYRRARESNTAAWRTRQAGRVVAGMRERAGIGQEGAQRVSQAKAGVDTGFGSAAVIRGQTDAYSSIDMELIKLNAGLAADEYDKQAEEQREAGRHGLDAISDINTATSLNMAGAAVGGLVHLTSMADRAGLSPGPSSSRKGSTGLLSGIFS